MTPDRFLCWSRPEGNILPKAHITASAIGYTSVTLNGAATLLIGTDTRCIISAGRDIALIGMVFDRDNRAVTQLEPPRTADAGALVDWLFQNFWGSYVAVMTDPEGRAVIARDPSATAQCYLLEAGNLSLAGNRVRDMVRIADIKPRLDWTQVIRHLMAIQYRSEATSLAGIIELLPGSMRRLTTGSDSELRWTPWRFADREELILDPSQAGEVLRQAILSTSKAWASQFRHGVLCLSGGLDSSILAAALVNGGLSCTAVNFLSGTRAGDEYRFAKTVANALARRSKGTPDGYLVILFERHRKAIRCLLHEGNLAKQGLIDLDAVDRVIGREGPVRGPAYARILSLCDIEAWAQSWH